MWTPRESADYARIGGDGPVIVGSAATVADTIEEIVEETGVSGFNLAAVSQPETRRGCGSPASSGSGVGSGGVEPACLCRVGL
ncbi:hypothetical protein [Leucobacter tenebrionis]|uniref:hypothetical protein n=1 Tax=Leucobacter tenebrionis TaxID=2873270 RepID=UPI001CA69D2C|nr:hypothetical protein [Leucobacter tenebrionis]QZY50585.1 hypothetical protein KVY00_07935 [Leucobacter tenebrionis]